MILSPTSMSKGEVDFVYISYNVHLARSLEPLTGWRRVDDALNIHLGIVCRSQVYFRVAHARQLHAARRDEARRKYSDLRARVSHHVINQLFESAGRLECHLDL